MVFATDHIFTGGEADVLLGASKSKGWERVKTQPQLHPPPKDYLLKAKSVLNFIHVQEQAATPVSLSVCGSINSSHMATWCEELTHWKRLYAGRDWGQEEKGTTEDEMAGWHHRLDGRESEWTLGVGDGQGGLACWDSWGHKESDTTEWLNRTELSIIHMGLIKPW